MKFGDSLRILMEKRNISQKQLAEDLDMPSSTLGNYIRNLREPDFDTLKIIASYFSASINDLLNYNIDNFCEYRKNESMSVLDSLSLREIKLIKDFRSMTKSQKSIFYAQGRVVVKYNEKNNKKSNG